MASRHLRNFLLYGTVRDSANFPNVRLLFQAPFRLTLFYQDIYIMLNNQTYNSIG